MALPPLQSVKCHGFAGAPHSANGFVVGFGLGFDEGFGVGLCVAGGLGVLADVAVAVAAPTACGDGELAGAKPAPPTAAEGAASLSAVCFDAFEVPERRPASSRPEQTAAIATPPMIQPLRTRRGGGGG